MRPALRPALWTAAGILVLGLAAVLVWRTALVGGRAALGLVPDAESRTPREKRTVPDGGRFVGVTFRYFDPADGRLVLVLKAARGGTSGAECVLDDVQLDYRLEAGRGRLLASGRTGTYDRATGAGRLTGAVRARRFPEGQTDPDLTMTGESLAWSSAAGTLSSHERVEAVWLDRAGGRTATASGTGLFAERAAERVRLERDVRLSLAGAALPADFRLGRPAVAGDGAAPETAPQGRSATVATCAGPAVFERDARTGCDRVTLRREVAVRSAPLGQPEREVRLDCDELEIRLRGPDRAPGADAPELEAIGLVAAAPVAGAAAARWLAAALSPRRPPHGGRASGDAGRVDLATARGGVRIGSRDGSARGHLAWYDGPAGILWLEGREGERAEVVRPGQGRTLAGRLWCDVHSGATGVPAGEPVTVVNEK